MSISSPTCFPRSHSSLLYMTEEREWCGWSERIPIAAARERGLTLGCGEHGRVGVLKLDEGGASLSGGTMEGREQHGWRECISAAASRASPPWPCENEVRRLVEADVEELASSSSTRAGRA
jgi:hypothetical protein